MRRTQILSSLTLVLALGLAACGTDDGDGVATLSDDATATSDADGGTGDDSDDAEDQAKKFEECMADHGIDLDDHGIVAGSGDGMHVEKRSRGGAKQDEPDPAEKEKFDAALKECGKYMPTEELSPQEEADLRENALAYVECLREQGFDVPDPKIEGGGISMGFDGEDGGPDFDPEDPAFQAAEEECMDKHMDAPGDRQMQQEES